MVQATKAIVQRADNDTLSAQVVLPTHVPQISIASNPSTGSDTCRCKAQSPTTFQILAVEIPQTFQTPAVATTDREADQLLQRGVVYVVDDTAETRPRCRS